jgi:hypothetical protein
MHDMRRFTVFAAATTNSAWISTDGIGSQGSSELARAI